MEKLGKNSTSKALRDDLTKDVPAVFVAGGKIRAGYEPVVAAYRRLQKLYPVSEWSQADLLGNAILTLDTQEQAAAKAAPK